MVDSKRFSSSEFHRRSESQDKTEKYAKIWFANLAKFHKTPASNSWSYEKSDVIEFLRDRMNSGVPTWKRLKIVEGLIWHRVHIQRRTPDFLLDLEKILKRYVVKEKIEAMPNQDEIEGIVGKINPNEPDVIQQLRRVMRAKGNAYNTEKAYVKKVRAFMAERNLKTLADFDSITSRDVESHLTDLAVDGNVAASILIRAADRGKMPQACPAELHVSR
ncbi:phage integrase N-terminal SAM-like domain-containing protein [Pirellulaceae bacterium SH449]